MVKVVNVTCEIEDNGMGGTNVIECAHLEDGTTEKRVLCSCARRNDAGMIGQLMGDALAALYERVREEGDRGVFKAYGFRVACEPDPKWVVMAEQPG